MSPIPQLDVEISGFSDEVCSDKRMETQLAVAAALGMRFISLRFFNLGRGIKNILDADDHDLSEIQALLAEYSIRVSSIGSPLGKIKLLDQDDQTTNRFCDFESYLKHQVVRICDIARRLNVSLVRGFTFYPPRGSDPWRYVAEAADRVARIAEVCRSHQLIFGIEVEANLVGQSGRLVAEIIRQANQPNLLSIFDGANLVCQGLDRQATWEEWLAMRPSLGWLHIKDYRHEPDRGSEVDEEKLAAFVPVGSGDSGYDRIFLDLSDELERIRMRLKIAGMEMPTVYLDLEPHLQKGGQFGGCSGPAGFGIAYRALCTALDGAGLRYSKGDSLILADIPSTRKR